LLLGGARLLNGMAVRRLVPLTRVLSPGSETSVTHGVVVEQVRAVAQLVTRKVMAGIDLDAGTQVDVDQRERKIRVGLPRAKVLGVEVTQLRTYDERSGLWNPFRPADRDTIYSLAREQLISAAGELGVAAHAEESARRLLGAMIHADGYT